MIILVYKNVLTRKLIECSRAASKSDVLYIAISYSYHSSKYTERKNNLHSRHNSVNLEF